MQLVGARDSVDRPAALSPWTLMHFAMGVFAYGAYAAYFPGLARRGGPLPGLAAWSLLHLAYEAKDYYVSYHVPAERRTSPLTNSWHNSVGDQLASMLGFAAGARLGAGLLAGVLAVAAAYALLATPLFVGLEHQDRRWALAPGDLWRSRG